MDEKKEYQPIMVIYLDKYVLNQFSKDHINNLKKEFGYPIIFIAINDINKQRVEIISVDKATVVEDVQKYIDERLIQK